MRRRSLGFAAIGSGLLSKLSLGVLTARLLTPQLAQGQAIGQPVGQSTGQAFGPPATATLIALRTWPAPDAFRAALEYQGALSVQSFILEDGFTRLVVDIDGLAWSVQARAVLNQLVVGSTLVDRIRAAVQPGTTTVRAVLDLKRSAVAEVSTVAGAGQYQPRILIDIYPAKTDLLGLWLARQHSSAPEFAGPGAQVPASIVEPKTVRIPDALGSSAKSNAHTAASIEPRALSLLLGQATAASAAMPVANSAPAHKTVNTAAPIAQPSQPAPTFIVSHSKTAKGKNGKRIKTIAIDAGHGGEDPGAIGPGGTMEKDVVLAMAMQLAKRIYEKLGWNAVLTRDGDYFVPLAERVQKARAAKADLFVSLHADAFYTPTARGASVYALSEKGASSAAAKWIANKENDSDLIGGLNLSDKDKQLTSVLLDLSTTAQIKASLTLGKRMVQQLGAIAHLHKSHVEQAGFAVLKAPDIPSLLVETAFISHPSEERLLASPKYQAKLVAALTKAIATI